VVPLLRCTEHEAKVINMRTVLIAMIAGLRFTALTEKVYRTKLCLPVVMCSALFLFAGVPPVTKADQHSSDIAQISSTPPDDHIYTWIGNTTEWNRKMHVSGYRMGCNLGDPHGCVKEAADAVQKDGVSRIFLSMLVDEKRALRDAREFSRLSVSNPFIVEIGFDDFVGRFEKLLSHPGFLPASWLREMMRSIKADNAQLAFGITLYEDELGSPVLHSPDLPPDVRRSVDYVHLFLHYRSDAPHISEYVARTRSLFPSAKIIAGLYAYDRVDYISCSPLNNRPCSSAEESEFYKQAVTIVAHMLKQGHVYGIEFYPGFFGIEEEWVGWKHTDYCSPQRVQECIAHTRVMRQNTVEGLANTMDW
jgi:hypothetical protein